MTDPESQDIQSKTEKQILKCDESSVGQQRAVALLGH